MRKSAIARIVIWSLVIALLLGLLIVGLGYRHWRVRDFGISAPASVQATEARRMEPVEIAPGSYTVTQNLNIRETPSPIAPIAGMLEGGDTVSVERSDTVSGTTWAYISSPQEGWVVADYLEGAGLTDSSNTSVPANQVKKISVDWAAGRITVRAADVSEISFYETGNSKYPMVWKLRDGKLDIDFCEDDIHFGLFNFGEKDLTILVPRDFSCEELEVDTASTTLEVSDLTIREVELDTASGVCRFRNCNISDLDVDTASGDVYLEGTLNTLDFDAASAKFTGVLSNTPSRLKVDSASGDLDLTLPEDTGFTVKMDGMSNGFTSDLPTTTRNGSHIYGDGRCLIEVDGMSSDVVIRKSEASSPVPTVPEAPTTPDAPAAPDAPTAP